VLGRLARALLQFSFTGHGWDGSASECGEFCEVSYRIVFDGEEAANVSVWRTDCAENPVSDQFGTWMESRNGWCPGSALPGFYFDITDVLRRAAANESADNVSHHVALYVAVKPEGAVRFRPYENTRMFPGVKADIARFYAGMTLFMYEAEAVKRARAQPKAFTAAETALRLGRSDPQGLISRVLGAATSVLETQQSNSFMEVDTEASNYHHMDLALDHPLPRPAGRRPSSFMDSARSVDTDRRSAGSEALYNSESRFPWYTYSRAREGPPGQALGAVRVPVMTERLVQGATRMVVQDVSVADFPKSWSRVSLYLRLYEPEGISLDFWDRFGSVGLFLPGQHVGKPWIRVWRG